MVLFAFNRLDAKFELLEAKMEQMTAELLAPSVRSSCS